LIIFEKNVIFDKTTTEGLAHC